MDFFFFSLTGWGLVWFLLGVVTAVNVLYIIYLLLYRPSPPVRRQVAAPTFGQMLWGVTRVTLATLAVIFLVVGIIATIQGGSLQIGHGTGAAPSQITTTETHQWGEVQVKSVLIKDDVTGTGFQVNLHGRVVGGGQPGSPVTAVCNADTDHVTWRLAVKDTSTGAVLLTTDEHTFHFPNGNERYTWTIRRDQDGRIKDEILQ